MKSLELPAKECPIIREVDVVVCGGGSGGMGAAVAAARLGMKVVILERFGCLGGLLTTGLVTTCMSGVALSGDKILIKGVFEEFTERCVKKNGAIRGYDLKWSNKFFTHDTSRCEKDLQVTTFDPEAYKLVAEELAEEYGIEVMYYTLLTDCVVEGNKIKAVVVENKDGRQIIEAKQFIDSTGDSSLARMAGVPCTSSGDKTPMTLMFTFGGASDVVPSYKPDVTEIPYGAINFFPMMRKGEFRAEMTRYVGNPISATDLTKASIECRRQVPEVLDYIRKNVPGCEDVYLLQSASVIGTLVTPHIIGEYQMQKEDILDRKLHEDDIALTAYGIDIHSDKEGGQNFLIWLDPGEYYGIPYRILYPKDTIDNLLAGGRGASSTNEAMSSICCCGITMALGEAAGTAAALCVKEGTIPRNLDVKLLQKTLVDNGQILEPVDVPDQTDMDWTHYWRKYGTWNDKTSIK